MWVGLDYLFLLADEDTAGVSCFAAVEGEQQVQGREAEAFDFRAAAWASTCDNVWNSIAIVDYQFLGC